MDKLTAELMRKMIAFSEGNLHDINHFLKVYAYARTIAVGEGVPDDVREKDYDPTSGEFTDPGYVQALEWLAEGRLHLEGRRMLLEPASRPLAPQPELALVWPPLEEGF